MMNNDLLSRLQRFQQSYSGDPRQQIQQMLNSGKISQTQYDNAVKQANQIAKMFGLPHP